MISIEIDNNKRIVKYIHIGSLYIKDFREAWEVILQLHEFANLNYDLISDYREANFFFGAQDLENVGDFLLALRHILKDKNNAIITDNPFSAAFSLLLFGRIQSYGFKAKVFSNEKDGTLWLTTINKQNSNNQHELYYSHENTF